jgi:hypothetical protein
MNNEVEAYVGELKQLREENAVLKEQLKEYEVEIAWTQQYQGVAPQSEKHYDVQWYMHGVEYIPK